MAILFDSEKNIFTVETKNTKYVFQIVFDKFPVHLFYGEKDGVYEEYKTRFVSYAPYYKEHWFHYSPDIALHEYSGFDSGDFRTSSLKIRNANGDNSTELIYKDWRTFVGRLELPGLPYADADEKTETLEITMADDLTGVEVKL